MSKITYCDVGNEYNGWSLVSWFREKYPHIKFHTLQKLLRTGQIRVDGARVKSAFRLSVGQNIRVPPLDSPPYPISDKKEQAPPHNVVKMITDGVLFIDKDFLVINKPAGLAVQGGTKINIHINGMLDFLKFGNAEAPRLVHRLDKETSGALLLARSKEAATMLSNNFMNKEIKKSYLSFVVGKPAKKSGVIQLNLQKERLKFGEKVVVNHKNGKLSQTKYKVMETKNNISLISLEPITGRTHQIRVHLSIGLGTPILCDGKYGGEKAFVSTVKNTNLLYLHANAIRVPSRRNGYIDVFAPIPKVFLSTAQILGFDLSHSSNSFL